MNLEVLANFCVGQKIGSGSCRDVHIWLPDPTLVIKIEKNTQCHWFQNVMEWKAWQECSEFEKAAKWLAPCVLISECGTMLLQKKTTKIRSYELPNKVPEFLADFKPDNFGMLDGKPVAHDYGSHMLMTYGNNCKLKKPEWYIPEDNF